MKTLLHLFAKPRDKELGPARMVWSGNSPHIADVHMKGYSATNITKVKGGNLQRLLNWA